MAFVNIVGIGENPGNQSFLVVPQSFLPYQRQKLSFNSSPYKKILDIIKFRAFADYKINVVQITISVYDRAKKLWEKERRLVISIFSLSHNVFKRLFYLSC